MDKKQFSLLVVLVIVSGFIGGMVSGRVGAVQAKNKDLTLDTLTVKYIFASNGMMVLDNTGKITITSKGIKFRNRKGKQRPKMFVEDNDNPVLALSDENEKDRFHLRINPENGNKPFLAIKDKNGESRAVLGASIAGSPKTSTEHRYGNPI